MLFDVGPRFHTGMNWLSAKWSIVRDAFRAYRTHPHYRQPNPAAA